MVEKEELLQQLDSDDIAVKKKAIFQLGEKKVIEAIPTLMSIMESHPDNVVRNTAARSFGKMGDKSDEVYAAFEKATEDPDIHVKANACWSLGKLKDPRAIPILEKMVDPIHREYTFSGERGKEEKGNAISTKLKEEGMKSSDVIIAAVKALGMIKDPAGIPGLLIALKDEDDGAVRCAAALALGKIKDASAVPPLINAMDDKYWYVRRDVAKALQKLKDPRAAVVLASKINDMYDQVREFSMKALLAIGKDAGATIFKLYLKNPKNVDLQNFIKKKLKRDDLIAILEDLIETDPSQAVYKQYLAQLQSN